MFDQRTEFCGKTTIVDNHMIGEGNSTNWKRIIPLSLLISIGCLALSFVLRDITADFRLPLRNEKMPLSILSAIVDYWSYSDNYLPKNVAIGISPLIIGLFSLIFCLLRLMPKLATWLKFIITIIAGFACSFGWSYVAISSIRNSSAGVFIYGYEFWGSLFEDLLPASFFWFMILPVLCLIIGDFTFLKKYNRDNAPLIYDIILLVITTGVGIAAYQSFF